MNDKPLVSVLMTVYNAVPYLSESIESILQQTYSHFEFIIVDDASEDEGLTLIRSYAQLDSRIQVIAKKERTGPADSSNFGLEKTKGKYILRMDADDISFPHRVAKLVHFMESNPHVDVAGSWAYAFRKDWKNKTTHILYQRPTQSDQLILELYFRGDKGYLMHPTSIIRKATLDKYNFRYNPDCIIAGDRELWCQMSTQCTFANLSEPLIYYRLHGNQNTVKQRERVVAMNKTTHKKYLQKWMPQASPEELELHAQWQTKSYTLDKNFVSQAEAWSLKVIQHNQEQPFFNPHLLKERLGREWFILLNQATFLQTYALKKYLSSPLRKTYPIGYQNFAYFFIDCLLKRPSRYLSKNPNAGRMNEGFIAIC